MTAQAHAIDTGTRLAIDRTRLAYERTMMAWIRTATSLISFGFTIYKFFQLELKATDTAISARTFALIMISAGLLALVLAGVQHRGSLQSLRQEYGPQPHSVSGPVALVIGFLGVLALTGVILRA